MAASAAWRNNYWRHGGSGNIISISINNQHLSSTSYQRLAIVASSSNGIKQHRGSGVCAQHRIISGVRSLSSGWPAYISRRRNGGSWHLALVA